MLKWLCLCLAIFVAPVFAQNAELLSGGDFETAGEGATIVNWYVVTGSDAKRVEEAGNHFGRLKVAKADTSSLIQREIPLPDGWKGATLSARVRYEGVAAGKKSWNDARVQLIFTDDKRKTVGKPLFANYTGTSKDWKTATVTGAVPAGATKIKVQIGLFDVAGGTLDIDDVKLTPGAAATEPPAPAAKVAVPTTQPLPYEAMKSTFVGAKAEGKNIAGWFAVNGSPEIATEKDVTFLRLAATDAEKTQQIRRYVPLNPDWGKLTLAARLRHKNVRHGEKNWQNARIIVEFLDDKNKRISAPAPMDWKGTSKGGWIDESAEYAIPFGAAQVKIEPALLSVESGTLELASLTVTITESRTELAKVDLLPDDWKTALVPHWRRATATREAICLNGVWQVRPIGLADGDPKQITAGVIQTPPLPSPMPAGLGWGYAKVPSTFPGTNESAHEWKLPSAWSAMNWANVDAAWFRRSIDVPVEWKGRRVLLDIDTPQSMVAVFAGEKLVGRINYPAGVVDLTEAVPAGTKAELTLLVIAKPFSEARVHAMNPNEVYLESTDLKQRGLCGDVFLRSEPVAGRITDVQFRPTVRGKRIGVQIATADVSRPVRVKFETGQFQWTSDPMPAKDGQMTVAVPWTPGALWDIDAPNLFDAKVSLIDDGGAVVDQVQRRTGFREFWIDGRDLIMNGSPVHLRFTKIASTFAGRSKGQMAGAFKRMREMGFNAVLLDYSIHPGSAPSYTPMLEAADETGVLVVFTIPSLLPFKSDVLPTDDERKAWEALNSYCIRVSQDHPSVIAYSTNHNRLGYHSASNPDKMDGTFDAVNPDPAFAAKRKIAADMEAWIRKQDPTREVYHHSAGNFGTWETNNTYLNWMPLQERRDYIEHWGTKGVKPLFLTEFGMPFVASWGRYKGPGVYRPTADSEPLFIEYSAALNGTRAYEINGTHEQYVDQYEKAYAATGKSSWAVLTNPWMRRSVDWNFVEIQARHANETFPAMRTWGLSAILPWDYKSVATWTDKTPAKVTLTEPAEQWTTPGLHPDFMNGSGYSVDETWFNSPAADTFRITTLGEAYKRVNADVLGWIAGRPENFTEVTHLFVPGQTVTKQVIVINDQRRELKAKYTATVTVGDRTIETTVGDVIIAPGKQSRDRLQFSIPADAAGEGKISLTLSYDGKTSTDEFAFTIVSPSAKPQVDGVVIWDPKGLTTKSLGMNIPAIDGTTIPNDAKTLLVGREGLSVNGAAPDIRPLLARGGRVIVFEQTDAVLTRRLGFRTAAPSMRNVFIRTPGHPLLAGLTDTHLRDWAGDATLTPPRTPGLPAFETKYPTADWLGFRNTRVWKSGNGGQVASVVIEKPQTGDFLPLLDGGFDLQYAPLLLARAGGGEILFCQMDVSGRTADDPAAQQMLANLVKWSAEPIPQAKPATFIGDEATRTFLASLGAQLAPGEVSADGVTVIGPDITADRLKALLPTIEKSRGTVVFLAAKADALAGLAGHLSAAPAKLIADAIDDKSPAVTAGVGPAELHLRSRTAITAVTPKSGWQSKSGTLAQVSIGDAKLVFVQIDPRAFDYTAASKIYVKLTHNRTRTLLSRVLANVGVPMSSPLLDLWTSPASQAELDLTKLSWQAAVGDQPTDWKPATVPGPIDHADFKGTFWYQVKFDMPADLTSELLLTIGNVDDEDSTTLNGRPIGHVGKDTHPTTYYKQLRQYKVPRDVLKAKDNVLLIKGTNIEGPAGILEGPVRLAPPAQRWLSSYYQDTPVATDDPYRYYRW